MTAATGVGRGRPGVLRPGLGGRPAIPRPFSIDLLEQRLRGRCLLEEAADLGLHPRQIYRWRQSGLTERQADELAVRCGFHPAEVWPDW